MTRSFSSQVAVVVGGASGIGKAIAAAFARDGAAVAILDRDPAVERVAAEIARSCAVAVTATVIDVTDYAGLERAAADIAARHDRVDHVAYAAGAGSGKYGFPFWNLAPSDWTRCVQVTLMGAVHTAHAFTPLLIGRAVGLQARPTEGRTLLFISSIAGQVGSQTDPPYSAAKAGLINFAQCAAKDLAAYGVRVNTICPGMIRTPLNESVWRAWHDRQSPEERMSYDDWAADKIRRVTPLGRWQEPEDVAELALFLASAKAKNITGQTMNVDGGQVMHW